MVGGIPKGISKPENISLFGVPHILHLISTPSPFGCIFPHTDPHTIIIQTVRLHKPSYLEPRLLDAPATKIEPLGVPLAVTVVGYAEAVSAVGDLLYGV